MRNTTSWSYRQEVGIVLPHLREIGDIPLLDAQKVTDSKETVMKDHVDSWLTEQELEIGKNVGFLCDDLYHQGKVINLLGRKYVRCERGSVLSICYSSSSRSKVKHWHAYRVNTLVGRGFEL